MEPEIVLKSRAPNVPPHEHHAKRGLEPPAERRAREDRDKPPSR
jgi:hypothetical protein